MNRKEIIEQLTMYELEFLLENSDKHTLTEMTDFFATGGFNSWSDGKLKEKFEMVFSEEEN